MVTPHVPVRALLAAAGASLLFASGAAARPAAVGWGYNASGEVGAGYIGRAELAPVSLVGVAGVKQLTAAAGSSAALREDGTVEAWGGNRAGQLGDGTLIAKQSPVTVVGLSGPVTQLAIAGEHTIALLANGSVETWGQNGYGTLGIGTTGNGSESCCHSAVPVAVPGLRNVVQVAAGGADDAVLLADGHVYAWGENRSGQLGDGTTTEKDTPTLVDGLAEVRAIALGGLASVGGHLLALMSDGTVRAIGENGAGQLGDGTTTDSTTPVTVEGLTHVTQLAASASHNLALLADGSVRAWGSDKFGELGSEVATGCGRSGDPCATTPIVVPLPQASAVSAGLGFSLAIAGGRVYSWGKNRYGTLGDGTQNDHTAPTPVGTLAGATLLAAGEQHALALVAGNTPPPLVELEAGFGSLTVSWSSSDLSDPWRVALRPAAEAGTGVKVKALPFASKVELSPEVRTYTFTELGAQRYEVLVESKGFGRRIIAGTPQLSG